MFFILSIFTLYVIALIVTERISAPSYSHSALEDYINRKNPTNIAEIENLMRDFHFNQKSYTY